MAHGGSEEEQILLNSLRHVMRVCRLGGGAKTCRYLASGNGGEWVCALRYENTELKKLIDRRAELGSMNAMAINCEGRTL